MTDLQQVRTGDKDDWRINWSIYGGPWIVECGLTTANPDVGAHICTVSKSIGLDGRDSNFAETQRRCYLIAAAPMLLAALKALHATHGKPMRDEWLNDAAFEHAKAVDEQVRLALWKAEPPEVKRTLPAGQQP